MIITIGNNLYYSGEAAFSINPHDRNVATLAYQSSRTFPEGFRFLIDGDSWKAIDTKPSKYARGVRNVTLERVS